MADMWRVGVKTNRLENEDFLFLEFHIERRFVIARATVDSYLQHLKAPEFAEIQDAILSFKHSEEPLGVLTGAQLPWRPFFLPNEMFHAFAELAMQADQQVSWRTDGSVADGVTTLSVTIAGREYAYSTRSAAQTQSLADQFTVFKTGLESIPQPSANIVNTIRTLGEIIDWVLRAVGVWGLYEAARRAKEAQEAQEREAREFKEKLERTEGETMDYDNEREFDRISRTA